MGINPKAILSSQLGNHNSKGPSHADASLRTSTDHSQMGLNANTKGTGAGGATQHQLASAARHGTNGYKK